MDRNRTGIALRIPFLLAGIFTLLLATGCVGIYNNSNLFKYNSPTEGMPEIEMLQTYGAPSFATEVGMQKVYIYRVRDNKYIILVGLFDGTDLTVTCEEGKVVKVNRVERPKAFSLFQPWNWSDTE